MALRIRKNNKANNALAGLERGLANGFQMGMEARRTRAIEEDRAFQRQQALKEAQRIDQEMQREEQERAAGQEAVGEFAQSMMPGRGISAAGAPPQFGGAVTPQGGTPFGGPAMQGNARPDPAAMAKRQKWARIGEIAKRMKPQAAMAFIEATREREKEMAKEQGQERVRKQFETMISDGSFKLEADESGMQSPEEQQEAQDKLDSTLEQIGTAVAGDEFDPDLVQQQIAKVSAGLTKQDARKQFRIGKATQQRADIDSLAQAVDPTGKPKPVSNAQKQKLEMMHAAYKRNAWMFDDKNALAKFEAEWADAMAGVADRNGMKIPLDQVQAFDRMQWQQMQALNAEKIKTEQARQFSLMSNDGSRSSGGGLTGEQRLKAAQDAYELAQKAHEDGDAAGARYHFDRARALESGGGGGAANDPDADLRAQAEKEYEAQFGGGGGGDMVGPQPPAQSDWYSAKNTPANSPPATETPKPSPKVEAAVPQEEEETGFFRNIGGDKAFREKLAERTRKNTATAAEMQRRKAIGPKLKKLVQDLNSERITEEEFQDQIRAIEKEYGPLDAATKDQFGL